MMDWKRSLAIALLAGFPALAADQVVLTNGDTITGAIVKKDGAKLTIKSEFLGEVTMPWSAVKTIRSESEVTVVLPTGETVKGRIATAGDELQVASGAGTKSAPLAGVTAVRNDAEQRTYERLEHPRLRELWVGNFDIGLALARGNSRTDTLTTAFTATRATRNDKISTYFNQIYGTARIKDTKTNIETSSTIASAIRGGWKYNRNFDGRLFVTGFNDYEHDQLQRLDLRYVAGGGLGVRILRSDNAQLDFDGGVDYQRENFDGGVPPRNSAEVNFGDAALYRISKSTQLAQSFRTFINLSKTGEYRVNFDISINTTLKKWLGWHVTASDRFLSNPIPNSQRNDVLLATGLRITFAK